MTIHEFVRALEEQGVLVTEGLVDGELVVTLEVYREDSLTRFFFVPEGKDVALRIRRTICEILGLKEEMIPVSTRDILEPE